MNLEEAMTTAGVDYEITLNRFSNNEKLLEKFVRKFPGDATFSNLQEAVSEKRYPEIERAAHTLKGIAANLGFQNLSELNAEIVNLIRSGQFADKELEGVFSKISGEYEKIIDCVNCLDERG